MLSKSKDKVRFLGITDYKDYDDSFKEINRTSARCIIIEDNKIYLSYSRKNKYYKLPGGGVNDGECKRKAAARETLEEVGVKVDYSNMVLYGVYIDKWKSVKKFEDNSVWINKSYYYICKRVGDVMPIKPTKSEIFEEVESRFVSLDEAIKINEERINSPEFDERFLIRENKIFKLIKNELL